PIFSAIDWMAAHCEEYSLSCSNTIRTARSRTSGEYFFACLMTPISQRLEPPANPGRFMIATLDYLFRVHGEPEYIRSDNGPEFIANAIKQWLAASGVRTLYIEPGSPWENAYIESFNSRLEDEL